MNICLSSRQSDEYLKKANEIKVQYRDKNSIPDLIFKYPEATIILECIDDSKLNWEEINKWNILSKNQFILCLANAKNVIEANKREIKSYLGWLINDYETLNSVLKLGVCYVRVAGSLFFDLENVKKTGAKVRITPNAAFEDGIPRENGIYGSWIRPEDLVLYDGLIDVIEFQCFNDTKKERALYRIYVDEKEWPGELNLLIEDLNYPAVNRLIHGDLAKKRIGCKQSCQRHSNCHLCQVTLDLANLDLLKQIDK